MVSSSGSKPPSYIATVPLQKKLTIVTHSDSRSHLIIDTDKAVQVAETNYAARFYFPREAIQSPYGLTPSEKKETYCPYKGFAHYYDITFEGKRVNELVACFWSYADPFPGSDAQAIRGLLCVDAPSEGSASQPRFDLSIDNEPLSVAQAKTLCSTLLESSSPESPAPSQTRDAEEQRQRDKHSLQDHSRRLMPPSMKRTPSSSSADPRMFQVTSGMGADVIPDSSNPILADIVYHLDDEARGEEAGGEHQQPQTSDEVVDEHLAWFKDKPWYRKPSYKWLRPFAFVISMAGGMCMGPKLELLNMFVCESVLGDPYVDGSIRPMVTSSLPQNATFVVQGFQPWHQPPVVPEISIYSSAVDAFFATLDQTNSTVLPMPKRPSKECYKSPEVQSALATLQLRMTLSMGILAALTTGYWSNLSSRMGRLPVLRLTMLGVVCTDILMLAVALVPRSSLPFGYSFLVLGTTLEGFLGGYSTLIAVHQSYISDVTPSGTRAHIFSHFLGVVWAGLGLGPTLGGLLVKKTNYILAPFWFALAMHVLYVVGVFTFIPESTSDAFRAKAAREYKKGKEDRKRQLQERKTAEAQPLLGPRRSPDGVHQPFKKRVWKYVKVTFMNSVLYAPLEPLGFLLPRKVAVSEVIGEDGEPTRSGSSTPRIGALAAPEASASHISVSRVPTKMRYDCNLFFLSMTYFVEYAIMGIMPYKMQFAQELFLWGSAEIGMYLTFSSLARVISLTLILPVAIKMLHRPVASLRLPHDGAEIEREQPSTLRPDASRRRSMLDDEGRALSANSYGSFDQSTSPHLTPDSQSLQEGARTDWDSTQKEVEELWTMRAKHLRLIHDSKFDLKLALWSIIINTAAYALLIFAKTPALYLLGTAITALGGGGGAAMSSLALALLDSPADAGKLFGAWSIISAIAGTVVGPVLFAGVFERTTRSFPAAIFVVATALFFVAIVLLGLVKVRKAVSLPSLPPRPHPVPSTEDDHTSTTKTPSFRASTWKNAMSLKTTAKGKSKRSAMPSFS